MLVLIGESASGKSSVAGYLVSHYGFNGIVTYTTREPRGYEADGVDYHFLSGVDFLDMKNSGFFAETAVYNGWYYGSARKDYIEDAQIKIAVLTPHGIRQLRKSGINNIYTVYIKVPRRDRLIKILQRGDNIEEAYRRNLSDVGQFDGVEDEADLVIENTGYKESIQQIAEQIISSYKLYQ